MDRWMGVRVGVGENMDGKVGGWMEEWGDG